jgi:formylglycine-generating enzyme required for sulfatase activity
VKPGQSDLIMFHHVRVAVMEKTSGDQVPWTEDGIQRRERVLFGGEAKPPSAALPTAPVPTQLSEAAEAWDRIKDSTSVVLLERFIARYKDTFYAEMAQAHVENLKKQQVATAAPPAPAPSKPAQPAVAVPQAPALSARCDGVEALVGNEKRCLKPKDSFRDCPNCPEMVVIPAGEFLMGQEPRKEELKCTTCWPQHKVEIALPFAVGRTNITRGQFAAFVKAKGYKVTHEGKGCFTGTYTPGDNAWKSLNWQSPGFDQDERHPVVCVSWHDAKAYADWLASTTGKSYRLLTEAEAEYVIRGTTKATPQPRFFFGNDEKDLCIYGNLESCNNGFKFTAPVGSFKPNPFGIQDVYGNVRFWVEDCWHDDYQGAPTDGCAWTLTTACRADSYMVRGSSWRDRAMDSALRVGFFSEPLTYIGFRLARTLNP